MYHFKCDHGFYHASVSSIYAEDEIRTVRLSILTDTHYYADIPDDPGAADITGMQDHINVRKR